MSAIIMSIFALHVYLQYRSKTDVWPHISTKTSNKYNATIML